MRVLVHPVKGNYRILFFDESHIRGVGIVDLSESSKGVRPDHYRLRWSGKKVYKNTPTKELLLSLRRSEVQITRHDPLFESFLRDFQVRFPIPMSAGCACSKTASLVWTPAHR